VAKRGVAGFRPDRLLEARTAAGLSQATLGRLVGVSETTVRSWERGTSAPTAHHLASIADAVKVTPAHLAPLSTTPQLSHLRQQAGLTQVDVAQALGVHPGSVGYVDAGRWWPSDAEQWAETYGVSLAAFQAAWETSRSHGSDE
jgi:transcriptional regulator with XRE-family HTH domain